MENEKLNHLFKQEIEEKNIDECTNAHLENICKSNNCSAIEFKDFLVIEKQFRVFQHPAGFHIYQRPNLNFQKLVDAIVHYHARNNIDYSLPPYKYKTLYEIASAYNNKTLSKDGHSFSMDYMLKNFTSGTIRKA